MNEYPLWKNLLVLFAVLIGAFYALPNLFEQNPSIEVSATRRAEVTEATVSKVEETLKKAGIELAGIDRENKKLLLRFPDTE
ncbi:MAG TPA: protein translocase subunit SecD, partial [Chromatiaceae bacterium]|nr:protein translocase subunit SecD [Chromatiaceae bacterium]